MRFEIIISYLDYYIIERVIKLRAKANPYIDQVTLAQKIGVSEGYVGQIENPRNPAKYNIRTIGKVAFALGLKSYKELLPDKVSSTDLVKVTYEGTKFYSNKHKPNKEGEIRRKYNPISVVPLTENEIEKWKKGELKYMTVIKK